MSAAQVVGVAMVAALFVGLFISIAGSIGLRDACAVYGITAAVVGFIGVATGLIAGVIR